MTVLDFLELPLKDLRQYCIDHGTCSHYDFESFDSGGSNCLDNFCSAFELEKGDIRYMRCQYRGSYCHVNFGFNFDFQSHVDLSMPRGSGNEIVMDIYGTNAKTLRTTLPKIEDHVYIWIERNDFFDGRETFNNLSFHIDPINKKTLAATIENLRQTANEIFPHIEFGLAAQKDGSYEKAYNSFNYNKFVIGNTIMHGFWFSPMMYARYSVEKKFGYTMDIHECLLFGKYLEEKRINWVNLPDDLDIHTILTDYKKLYVINDTGADAKKKIEDAAIDFKNGIDHLVQELSEKYGIHSSYFYGYGMANVRVPEKFNKIDLSKPFKFGK